jgi:hypothetical protein
LRGLHVVAVGDAKAVRRELETFGIVEMVSAGV